MSLTSRVRYHMERVIRVGCSPRGRVPGTVLIAIVIGVAATSVLAGPSRYGHSDRVERHMLPAVTTGPLDPAWSPDGQWIAFSMRGDIWKIPAGGGEAIALTAGPAWHFEPAWSPDGSRIALSFDVGGNLDIGVISANGGDVERITTDNAVDVEPAWSRDGASLYFVSARSGGFRIFRHDMATGHDTMIVNGIQPSVSPDGHSLAWVASVRGKLGTGGLWVKDLPAGEPRLVHYEETEYRMRPAWTPDGKAFLYGSDEMGSNDVAIIPADGGNPIVLTADAHGEFSPAPSPDGKRFAFVSNRTGPMTLYTSGIGGGPPASWTAVPIRSRRPRLATGTVSLHVLDASGATVPARVYLRAADGRAYAPDGGFHRVIAVSETHYFHTSGESDIEVPAGRVTIEAMRGFEYKPVSLTVDVPANGRAQAVLQLERLVDLPARGWYSGDTHVHDLHQGRFGLTHELLFDQLVAEDLHVTNALVHMDGTRLMGRWTDLTGSPHPLSTRDYILQYGEEYRGSLGHVAMLGVSHYILPLTGGATNTAYEQPLLDLPYFDGAREQGGLAGYVHPFLNPVESPADAANSLIPLDVALGRGDFYDIGAVYSDEFASAGMYYRLLNAGFRIPATSGTDNFSDVWRDPPPGTDRTFVHVDGALTHAKWLDGIRAKHTFGSTGPLLTLDVDGHEPGDEIAIAANASRRHRVRVEAWSIAPLDRVEIVANGRIVGTATPVRGDSSHVTFEGNADLPAGGWIAARASGPPSRYVADSYPFAQTSPVWIVRGGRPWTSAADARFLADAVAALGARVERSAWRTQAEHDAFMAAVEQARAVYLRIAAAPGSDD
jgi:TolB protein